MNPTNTGSFGNGQASPELLAAIQRRAGGNPGGPMAQTMTSAPTNNPQTQIPNSGMAPSAGSSNGLTSTVPSGGTMPGVQSQGLPINTPESELIIKALSSRLASFSKQEEARIGI